MKYKALFIHIPKTAGSSISTAPWILKHGSFEVAPTTDFHKTMLRFSFIRHPYERFASAVLNLTDNEGKPLYATEETFESFVESISLQEIMINDYYLHLRPMSWYLHVGEGMPLEFVGSFETLLEDWERVCLLVNEVWELPHHNKSGRTYDKFLTDPVKKKLAEIYASDFEAFDGYIK